MKKIKFIGCIILSSMFMGVTNNLEAQLKPKEKSTSNKKVSEATKKPNQNSQTGHVSAAFNPALVGRDPGSYAIKVKINGFKNVPIYLADNFADKQYFRDTCMLDANGVGTFTGSPKLQRGMYMIVFPKLDGYYELPITDDQTFAFEADSLVNDSSVIVSGSKENEMFVAYRKIASAYGLKRYNMELDMKKVKSEGNEILYNKLRIERDTLEAQDIRYREDYMKKNPTHYLTSIFKAFRSIKIPENPNPADSMFEYNYFRNHYWDNIDFSESGLIRAPRGLITTKLNEYIDKVSFQDPDSLIKAVDIAIGKTLPFTEMEKYFIQYLTNKFQDRKIMCQDNVTIHLIHNYYCLKDAWWYDDTAQKKKMCEDARKALPTMCGKMAPDLNMADTAGKMHRLYENLGTFTIVFFYDPTCGHCKEVIPVVNRVFQKDKAYGIKVYAISTENQYDEWRKMMRQKPELSEWINVCRIDRYYPWPLNKQEYNIVANPIIFILDENGMILGKKIHENQLEFFIESLLYEKGLLKTKPTPPKEEVDVKTEKTGEAHTDH